MLGCLYDAADELVARIRAAARQSDLEELGRLAHRPKGTVVYLGAPTATAAAHQVEQLGKSGDLAGAAEAIDALERHLKDLKEALNSHRAAGHADHDAAAS
ncbi:MAG: Hpt domain-containing protein [Pirellulales bacterium]|nr:Hpt domain-containing protein [Pirellulales bacterium]